MSATAEDCPVVNYNPAHYIPITVFRSQWEDSKENSADILEDPYGMNPHANSFTAGLHASAPLIIIVSMMVILLNTWTVRGVNPEAHLAMYLNFPVIIAMVGFIASFIAICNKVRFARQRKHAVDFAVLESARRYLTQRYAVVPENWEQRFISYLVEETVPENRFSEEYQLTVKPFKGFNVIMVANINGEAPLKNNL